MSFKPAEAAAIYNSLALLYSDTERNADAIAAYNASLQLEENVALYADVSPLPLQLVTFPHVREHGRAAAARRPQRRGNRVVSANAAHRSSHDHPCSYLRSIAMKPYVEAWHNLAGVFVPPQHPRLPV